MDGKGDRRDRGQIRKHGGHLVVVRRSVAVFRGAPESHAAEKAHTGPQPPRDRRVDVGMHIEPVIVGHGAQPIDVALARIAEMRVVAHGAAAARKSDTGARVGLGVFEHRRTEIGIGIFGVVGIAHPVTLQRRIAVQRRHPVVITRIVVHLGIVHAVHPLGETVNDAHAPLEPDPHRQRPASAAPGADVKHAVGSRGSELRLVGDVGQQRHRLDLLGIELQLSDVDRHIVNDIPDGVAACEQVHRRIVRCGGKSRRAALLHDLKPRNDSGEQVAEVETRILIEFLAAERTRAARAGRKSHLPVQRQINETVPAGSRIRRRCGSLAETRGRRCRRCAQDGRYQNTVQTCFHDLGRVISSTWHC